ncbi:MAG TPA: ABC transporter permease [Bryobacteraceae bacterium]|jgi:putative ABC transport system permease protein
MIPLSLRFYRLLLFAYPAPFRQEFAPEMMSTFRDRCVEESATRGWPGLILIWLRVLIDTLLTAPEEHYYMLMNDIRYAIRSLAKSRGFTLTAIGCLALGIGASTAIYSIVNAVLLRPLPYRDSEHFARLYTEFPKQGVKGLTRFWFSPPEYRSMKEQTQAWDQIEGWVTGGASIQGAERPLRVNTCYVTGGLMPMLGVAPALGRLIIPPNDDPGVTTAIVLSDRLWRTAFGSDPNIVGRELHLDGIKAVVAGVMPPSFEFPAGAADPSEMWVPLQLPPAAWTRAGSHFLSLVAHLRPGVSLAKAREELPEIERIIGVDASPKVHRINSKNHPLTIYGFQDEVIGNFRPAMLALMGAVAFFLLIACVNVANLLLARSDTRHRELAVRKAIGADNSQLFRQFAVEGLVLSLISAALGVGLAWIGVRFLISSDAGTIPRIREAGVDRNVLLFAVLVAVGTGLIFSLAPMMSSFRQSLSEALNAGASRMSGSLRSNRLRALLVVSEVALALMLLIGSGLLVRAFWRLQQTDAGMRPDHLLTARLSLTSQDYSKTERLREFWIRLNEKLSSSPGIVSATISATLPPEEPEVDNTTDLENVPTSPDSPAGNVVAFYQVVGDTFFETLGAKLLEGRFFDARDGFGTPPVAIINQTMAKTYWPGQSAIGKRLRPLSNPMQEYRTIVGVVADIRNQGVSKPAGTEFFQPARQLNNVSQSAYVIVRTSGDPTLARNAIENAVRAIDPTVPVSKIQTMEDNLGASVSRPRFLALALTLFSSLALALAGFGIYGLISYSVTQRTPEFGIRMALGADRGQVLKQVLGEGAALAGIGAAVGCIGAALMSRWLDDLLFGLSRFDPVTFGVTAAILMAASLFACWVPAQRATRVDPVTALRNE